MEIKDVLEALGLPDSIDSKEKLVEAHRGMYLLTTEAHENEAVSAKITGRIFGELGKEAKKLFDFSNEEIKDKPFREILSAGVKKHTDAIKMLEETAGKGSEEIIQKAKAEADKYKSEAKQYKGDLEKLVLEKQEIENTFTGKLKQFKVDSALKDAMGKLTFSESATDVAKIGFNTLFASKYKLDLGEDDTVVVLDVKGNKVPHPSQTGKYLSLSEVLEAEAKANSLIKQNNLPPARVTPFASATPPAGQEPKTRTIHPAAARRQA